MHAAHNKLRNASGQHGHARARWRRLFPDEIIHPSCDYGELEGYLPCGSRPVLMVLAAERSELHSNFGARCFSVTPAGVCSGGGSYYSNSGGSLTLSLILYLVVAQPSSMSELEHLLQSWPPSFPTHHTQAMLQSAYMNRRHLDTHPITPRRPRVLGLIYSYMNLPVEAPVRKDFVVV